MLSFIIFKLVLLGIWIIHTSTDECCRSFFISRSKIEIIWPGIIRILCKSCYTVFARNPVNSLIKNFKRLTIYHFTQGAAKLSKSEVQMPQLEYMQLRKQKSIFSSNSNFECLQFYSPLTKKEALYLFWKSFSRIICKFPK